MTKLSPNYVHITFEEFLKGVDNCDSEAQLHQFLQEQEIEVKEMQENFEMMNLLPLEGNLTMDIAEFNFDVRDCQNNLNSEIIRYFTEKQSEVDYAMLRAEKLHSELSRHEDVATEELLASAEVVFSTQLENAAILDDYHYSESFQVIREEGSRLVLEMLRGDVVVRKVGFDLIGDRQS